MSLHCLTPSYVGIRPAVRMSSTQGPLPAAAIILHRLVVCALIQVPENLGQQTGQGLC